MTDAEKIARLRELWAENAWLNHSMMALYQIRDEILGVCDGETDTPRGSCGTG